MGLNIRIDVLFHSLRHWRFLWPDDTENPNSSKETKGYNLSLSELNNAESIRRIFMNAQIFVKKCLAGFVALLEHWLFPAQDSGDSALAKVARWCVAGAASFKIV